MIEKTVNLKNKDSTRFLKTLTIGIDAKYKNHNPIIPVKSCNLIHSFFRFQ